MAGTITALSPSARFGKWLFVLCLLAGLPQTASTGTNVKHCRLWVDDDSPGRFLKFHDSNNTLIPTFGSSTDDACASSTAYSADYAVAQAFDGLVGNRFKTDSARTSGSTLAGPAQMRRPARTRAALTPPWRMYNAQAFQTAGPAI
jgi:hypothetical protein